MRFAEPEFGAPAELAEVSVEFPAAQPADIAGEAVAAPVEAWEPVAEVELAEAEATPPSGAIEATFEEVERPADAVAEDDDEARVRTRPGSRAPAAGDRGRRGRRRRGVA